MQFAKCLAEVVGDGMGAYVHAVGDLVVVQSLGDEPGHGLLGVGEAVPAGDGPGGGCGPVAAADAELARSAPVCRYPSRAVLRYLMAWSLAVSVSSTARSSAAEALAHESGCCAAASARRPMSRVARPRL